MAQQLHKPTDVERESDHAVQRIVYYGPGLSGKTANLEALAVRLEGGMGRLLHFEPTGDEGASCEFLACDSEELGWPESIPLHIYAGPGAYLQRRLRARLLKDVAGVVFVADSRRWRLDADMLLLDELGSWLAAAGRVPPAVGLVLQYNRSDDAESLSSTRLDHELNRHGGPSFTATAHDGRGVVETLHALLACLPHQGG